MGVITSAIFVQPGVPSAETESNITFGCGLATCLALLSAAISIFSNIPNPLPLFLATCTLLLVLWSPNSFGTANYLWKKSLIAIGQAFIVFIWIFYILPSGLIMQARGRDPLNLRFEPRAKTYWKTPLPTSKMEKSS